MTRHLRVVPDEIRPYQMAAMSYLKAGWSPLPLPPGEKSYPPVGYTGAKGRNAELTAVEQWIRRKGDGNIALRMPPNLLGIDVDNYEGKEGAATLAAAEAEWGPLPDTWRSTSRIDGVSGIRLFLIPEGLAWPGPQPQGGGGELCRWNHRYVIVAPSIHDKTGEQYHWFAPDGTRTTDTAAQDGDWYFPGMDELPALPAAWVEGLTSGKKWDGAAAEEDLDAEEVQQWVLDRPDGPLCDKMQSTLDSWMTKIRAAGDGKEMAAHDAALYACWAVLGDAAGGHVGVQGALRKIMLAHKEAIRGRRPEKAAAEWASMKARGVRKVAAEGPTDDDDPCATSAVSRAPRVRNRGSEGMDFERDDIGNGQRFALQWRDEVRWVPEFDKWYVWRDFAWTPDIDGEVDRMAAKTVRAMKAEAAYIEDTKEKGAFLKFVRASSNEGKLRAMLNRAKSNKGITVSAVEFDRNPSHLVCTNGTVELPTEFSGGKIRRIRSLQEHMNTVTTGADYLSDARLPEWDKFLERFQPDVEVRAWLQKLAGYSLLGSNPRRIMVVALGDSSTGKTTFAEAIDQALGGYAGSANMTIFRDNQDDRARPDLLRVLPMRFVYAEEASRSWHLHPDQIKRLTGGAPITARAMRANEYVDRVPSFTPWLFSNHAPTIDGGDTALWRRMLVVPFDVVIPKSEEDAGFRLRLRSPEGRQAILAWLVEGYRAYLAAPDSIQDIPAGALVANAKFRAEVNDLSMCLEDICDFGPELCIAPDDLYQAYRAWCETNNTAPRDIMSGTKFGREVSGEYPKKMMKVDGKPARMRTGLQLKLNWLKTMAGS